MLTRCPNHRAHGAHAGQMPTSQAHMGHMQAPGYASTHRGIHPFLPHSGQHELLVLCCHPGLIGASCLPLPLPLFLQQQYASMQGRAAAGCCPPAGATAALGLWQPGTHWGTAAHPAHRRVMGVHAVGVWPSCKQLEEACRPSAIGKRVQPMAHRWAVHADTCAAA